MKRTNRARIADWLRFLRIKCSWIAEVIIHFANSWAATASWTSDGNARSCGGTVETSRAWALPVGSFRPFCTIVARYARLGRGKIECYRYVGYGSKRAIKARWTRNWSQRFRNIIGVSGLCSRKAIMPWRTRFDPYSQSRFVAYVTSRAQRRNCYAK